MQKFDFRPYVSGDIETLGLNLQHSPIIELGFVLDTGEYGNVAKFEPFHCFIKHDHFKYSEPYAIAMNHRYFAEYQRMIKGESKANWLAPEEAADGLADYLMRANKFAIENFDRPKGWEKPMSKIQIAGKNFGSYDRQVIRNFFLQNASIKHTKLERSMDYAFIDVGPMFYDVNGYVPGLNEINKMTGRAEVSHSAYMDAIDVVFANRLHWCRMKGIDFASTTYFNPEELA